MSKRQTEINLLSKLLHWSIAILMIGLIPLGWFIINLDFYNPYYYSAPALHYSLGLLLFALVLIKLIYQLMKPLPKEDGTLTPFEKLASKMVHLILIFAMVIMPVTGYFLLGNGSFELKFFELFNVATIKIESQLLNDIFNFVHAYFGYVVGGLIILHVAAAVKHKFIDKHKTSRNMWFK